jgi:prepilin-type N-terminal cleavage/methylation domain-containing protein
MVTRRGGFTLVELVISMSIVGILAGLALPNLRTMIHRARATEVSADMEVVRVAALQFQAEMLSWPAEAASGMVPAGLEPFLPDGFVFSGDGYQLDYENWDFPSGFPGDPTTTKLIGVSVTADTDQLGNAVAELLGGSIVFSVGNTHTIVIGRI